MNLSEFRSKCCNARVIPDYTEFNEDNKDYTPERLKCVRCGKPVTEVIISRRKTRLR
jgi:hypothetical protein